jgi:hypothetical protein
MRARIGDRPSRGGRAAAVAGVLLAAAVASVGCAWLPVTLPGSIQGPSASPDPLVRLDRPSQPVRIRIPSLGIDLPVMSSARRAAWAPPGYPACDIALAWTRFDLPGEPGTTWVLAHAQQGMFLPLLTTSNATRGRGLLRRRIELQLRDGRLLTFRTHRVRQRAANSDVRIAWQGRGPREHRLVLQTSTGPASSDPKLQVAARLISATRTDESPPRPRPRPCSLPRRSR